MKEKVLELSQYLHYATQTSRMPKLFQDLIEMNLTNACESCIGENIMISKEVVFRNDK